MINNLIGNLVGSVNLYRYKNVTRCYICVCVHIYSNEALDHGCLISR